VIEAITVTDPGHPLYGRRFASARSGASGYVHVAHRDGTVLRLAVAATSLCPLPHDGIRTKLTLEAIRDLLRLAAEIPCWGSSRKKGIRRRFECFLGADHGVGIDQQLASDGN